jgi:three-Cys-motif partner protein
VADSPFFDRQTAASATKARIVSAYFWAWAQIITGKKAKQRAIGYVDLFAGPGVYGGGQKSTPILILEAAIRDADIGDKLHVFLNDKNPEYAASLRKAVAELPGIEKLAHQPEITNAEVTENAIQWLASKWPYPSLVFLDPWGYKGLTLQLIDAALRRKFSDVIFFFNFNRVNAAIRNAFMEDHVEALFTPARLEQLRGEVEGKSPEVREQIVMRALKDEVTHGGQRHWLDFKFTSAESNKTSHYIILVSKDPTGLKPMKDIMAKASSASVDGVASFTYAPKAKVNTQMDMFQKRPTDTLADELLRQFKGQTLAMKDVFYRHHENTKYRLKNYKDVILRLESEGKVTCDPPAGARPPRRGEPTLADEVRVTFP